MHHLVIFGPLCRDKRRAGREKEGGKEGRREGGKGEGMEIG